MFLARGHAQEKGGWWREAKPTLRKQDSKTLIGKRGREGRGMWWREKRKEGRKGRRREAWIHPSALKMTSNCPSLHVNLAEVCANLDPSIQFVFIFIQHSTPHRSAVATWTVVLMVYPCGYLHENGLPWVINPHESPPAGQQGTSS